MNPPLRTRWKLDTLNAFIKSRAGAVSAVLVCLLGATGCTHVRYTSATGETFQRSAFGAATSLSQLEVETGADGIRRIRLSGYHNNSADALGAVTEAAVRAAVQTR